MSEAFAYRDNLRSILEFSGGRHVLSIGEVRDYTGFRDYRAIKKRFPFRDNYISAETLARCLSGGECEK